MVNMTLMITLIVCCLLVVAINLAFFLYVRREEAKLVQAFVNFISSPDAETPSPFAQTILAMAQVSAPVFTQSLTGSAMGKTSAVAQAVDGIEGDIAGDMLAQKNPILSLLVESSPSLAKRLKRSPMAREALAHLDLGKFMGPGNGRKDGSASKSTFKLGE